MSTTEAIDQIDENIKKIDQALADQPTLIAFVLDRSGSMQSIRDATIAGFNEFRGEQEIQPGEAFVTLLQFDTEFEMIFDQVPIKEVPNLTRETFVPRGGTALFDAIGYLIPTIEKQIADLQQKPKVLFIIITDGGENSSKEITDVTKIRELIKAREQEGWEFAYIGANQDSFAAGGSMGISGQSTMNYAPTSAGTKAAYAAASGSVTRTRATGQSLSFTPPPKQTPSPKKKKN